MVQLDLLQTEPLISEDRFFEITNYDIALGAFAAETILEASTVVIYPWSAQFYGTLKVEDRSNPNTIETKVSSISGNFDVEGIAENTVSGEIKYVLRNGTISTDISIWNNVKADLTLRPSEIDRGKLQGEFIMVG